MDRLKTLLSFQGRATRLEYWRWFLMSSVLTAGLFVASISIALTEAPGSKILAGVLLAGVPLLLWPGLAVSVRRLHDRNKSGWWAALFWGMPIVANALASGWIRQGGGAIGALLALVTMIVGLWGLVELGFLRGARGLNSYGAEPTTRPRARRVVPA